MQGPQETGNHGLATLPIKQEEDLNDSFLPEAMSPTKPATRSPSLAMTEIDGPNHYNPDRLDLNRSDDLPRPDAIKADSKSATKPAKRQTARREYLPEEIPEEYREKPQFSYSHLIATALRAHPEASGISLSEIYRSIQDIFPFYKYCPHGWQNSVRHNLSSNKAFCKISKEGKGWLWGIDEEYFQERERLKKKAAANSMKAKAASASAAAAKAKTSLQQQDKDMDHLQQQQAIQSSEHPYQSQQQYQLHNQQFQQQLKSHYGSKDHPLSLPDPAAFIPQFQQDQDETTAGQVDPNSASYPPLFHPLGPEEDGNEVMNGHDIDMTSPKALTNPIKKEKAKTIAELASEIQIDGRNDRLYYSNMTRESYTERAKANPEEQAAALAEGNGVTRPPFSAVSASAHPHPPAVATNSIAQNDAILNSPRYQQYYSSTSTPPIPSTRVTTSLSANPGSTTAPGQATASMPAATARGAGSVQSMAAGQTTFRMTQPPKQAGGVGGAGASGARGAQPTPMQLQKQTSVPQMRVNPQIPKGVAGAGSGVGGGKSEGQPRQAKFSVTPTALPEPSENAASASSASAASKAASSKPALNSPLSSLNLPKDTLRILNLLQDKIKAQMQSSGQPINSTVLTNALAIAIAQLTKTSGGGAGGAGGAAALANLLKGKNQAQLVSALASAISSAKKPGASASVAGASKPSSSPAPQAASASSSSSSAATSSEAAAVKRSASPADLFKQQPQHQPKPLGIPVPAAISAPASLAAGSLPGHLSGIAKLPPSLASPAASSTLSTVIPSATTAEAAVPTTAPVQKSASPAPSSAAAEATQQPIGSSSSRPQSISPTPPPSFSTNSSSAPVSSTSAPPPPASAAVSSPSPVPTIASPATPATSSSGAAPKSKAELISEMLAKASKLTNPSPSIRAALAQLQAHATKLGLKIPDNLKNLDSIPSAEQPASTPSAAPSSASAQVQAGVKRAPGPVPESEEPQSKVPKIEG